ncbi:MAG: hypothetical protein IJ598_00900 [Ruminococcus sp.]|nr:hypothetical protein [Ruminococcus sp.]
MNKTIRQVADDLGVKSSAVYSKIRYKKYFSKVMKPYISKRGNTILISPEGQELLKKAFLNKTNPNELSDSAMNTSADLETSEQSNENSDAEINVSENTLGTSKSDEFAGDYLPKLPDFSDFEKQFWKERFDEVESELKKTELMLIELKKEQASLLSKIQGVSDKLVFNSKFNDISRVLEELEKMEKINKIRTFSFSVAAFCVLFILLYIITLLQ